MKTPQVPAMPGMSPLGFKEPRRATNEKTLAERQWLKHKLAPAPQDQCDIGLFGDGHKQIDFIDRINREEK
jgi:hypothetical protein